MIHNWTSIIGGVICFICGVICLKKTRVDVEKPGRSGECCWIK